MQVDNDITEPVLEVLRGIETILQAKAIRFTKAKQAVSARFRIPLIRKPRMSGAPEF